MFPKFFKNLSNDTNNDLPPPHPEDKAGVNFEILNRNPHFLLQIQIPQKILQKFDPLKKIF